MKAPVARRASVAPIRVGPVLILAGVLVLALAVVVSLGLTRGTPQLALQDLVTIAQGGGDKLSRIVVTKIRMPRVLLGVTAGMMLALAGALMQDTMRNALAGPELLGVSAGASLVIATITIFNLPVLLVLYPWLALAGSLITVTIILLTMRRLNDPVRLVLGGVAMTALIGAAIISIISMGDQNNVGLLYLYLLGSLANRTWDHLQLVLPWAVVGIPVALLCGRALNLMQLGDEVAEGLGLRIVRTRLLLVLLSAALVAAVVAVAGPIGYIALVSPHIARRILRSTDARVILPISALIGAVLLTSADLIAKMLFDPIEMPVGIWTTLIGGPILVLMLRRQLSARRATA